MRVACPGFTPHINSSWKKGKKKKKKPPRVLSHSPPILNCTSSNQWHTRDDSMQHGKAKKETGNNPGKKRPRPNM